MICNAIIAKSVLNAAGRNLLKDLVPIAVNRIVSDKISIKVNRKIIIDEIIHEYCFLQFVYIIYGKSTQFVEQ